VSVCTVPNCDRPKKQGCRDYCSAHQERLRVKGDVLADIPLRERLDSDICVVDGCDKPSKPQSRGRGRNRYCAGHMARIRRYGELRADVPLRKLAAKGTGCVTEGGYITDRIKGHPLAYANGQVRRHRVVLYDKIGPGSHRCHWCDCVVTWGIDLHTDHLDGVAENNDPANLVPSCVSCNTTRGNLGNPLEWSA
jgi:hypothetical protein